MRTFISRILSRPSMPEMFDTLDDFDWSCVEHAYGKATDVPVMIRAMASTDAEIRESAYSRAHTNIWHQGTVYSASAYAVPYIIEVACASELSDRDQALQFLGLLARGNSFLDVHQYLTFLNLKSRPNFEEDLAKELKWVNESRLAVENGRNKYLGLLKDSDAKVRVAAALLLSKCKDNVGETVEHLIEMFDSSTDVESRGQALHSATILASGSARVAECAKISIEDNDFCIRALGAYSLLQNGSLTFSARNVEVAVQVLMAEEGTTWNKDPAGSVFEQDMAEVFGLAILKRGEDEETARFILRAIEKFDPQSTYKGLSLGYDIVPVLCNLVRAAFGNGAPSTATQIQLDTIQWLESVHQTERVRTALDHVAEELGLVELFGQECKE